MNIETHELIAAWPKLPREVQQSAYIAVLEGRLLAREMEVNDLRHQIEVLEQAVKMPEGFARTNHSTPDEREFVESQLRLPVINEV